jgi:hypothetical protein
MAVSLKDHSDTWINATTFIQIQMHTFKVQEGVPACGWSPRGVPRQVRLVFHRGALPSRQFIWAEIAGSLFCWGGRATTGQDLSYSEILW